VATLAGIFFGAMLFGFVGTAWDLTHGRGINEVTLDACVVFVAGALALGCALQSLKATR